MIISTEYYVGQELYFLSKHTGKIECSPVYKIEATTGDMFNDDPKYASTIVRYFFYLETKQVEIVKENDCYPSKQQLIESL
jgi:hypothetical protein